MPVTCVPFEVLVTNLPAITLGMEGSLGQDDVQSLLSNSEKAGEVMVQKLSPRIVDSFGYLNAKRRDHDDVLGLLPAKMELMLPPLNVPIAWEANGRAEKEFDNLSLPMMTEVNPYITFTNENLKGIYLPHDDVLVMAAAIANFNVQRILIDDNGSCAMIALLLSLYNAILGWQNQRHYLHLLTNDEVSNHHRDR
ncbi:hypothetical protein Acr_00g0067830 [Actinidia rufa]|uniref:Uncharacterized protein n=1 Tax=Actinidia rufa TaxID=165716 RepID=A0A7J0DSM3_9ERIC|nr:hypothetical protein Acr_00g0067830 [Actinidia rufa]